MNDNNMKDTEYLFGLHENTNSNNYSYAYDSHNSGGLMNSFLEPLEFQPRSQSHNLSSYDHPPTPNVFDSFNHDNLTISKKEYNAMRKEIKDLKVSIREKNKEMNSFRNLALDKKEFQSIKHEMSLLKPTLNEYKIENQDLKNENAELYRQREGLLIGERKKKDFDNNLSSLLKSGGYEDLNQVFCHANAFKIVCKTIKKFGYINFEDFISNHTSIKCDKDRLESEKSRFIREYDRKIFDLNERIFILEESVRLKDSIISSSKTFSIDSTYSIDSEVNESENVVNNISYDAKLNDNKLNAEHSNHGIDKIDLKKEKSDHKIKSKAWHVVSDSICIDFDEEDKEYKTVFNKINNIFSGSGHNFNELHEKRFIIPKSDTKREKFKCLGYLRFFSHADAKNAYDDLCQFNVGNKARIYYSRPSFEINRNR